MKKVFTVKEQISESNFVSFEWQKTHGNYLATFGSSPRVSIYDRHGNLVNQINLEGKCVMLDWDQQGDVLAIIDNKSTGVYLWDVHVDKISKVETGFKDTLSFVKWSKFKSQLAVGTSKGNLLLYNHMSSRKVPILGKHSKRITCGAWSEEGLLALGSEDRTFTLSNEEGETIKQTPLRDLPLNIQFSEIKDDEKSTIKENTLSCTLANKTLFLFKLTDMENPVELAFQEKYGNIVDYKWFGDGYIMIGFSHGYLVVISTHKKEIGQELHQSQDYKDNLNSIGISTNLSKAVTVGDRCVKIHDLNALKELTAIIQLDEDGEAKKCSWSEDGQLLAISTISGNVHVFLTRLPMLASVTINGTKIAHLTSLREVSVDNIDDNFSSKVLPIELEPKFIGVSSAHLGVGMNNQVWFYRENAESYLLVSEQEYMKTVTKLQLNDYYSAAYYDGKVMLQMIENYHESDGKESKSRKLFPEQAHLNEYITSFELTSNFLIFSTDKGNLNIFYIEDWNYASEFKHECGISKIFSNEIGTAIIYIDSKSNAFFYSPLDEQTVEITDFPGGTNKVLWDYKNDENSMILVCTNDKLFTYTIQSIYVDVKKGVEDEFEMENRPKFEIPKIYGDNTNKRLSTTKIKLIGFTKAPFGHLPLFLKNGDIILLNQNGKLITSVLGTHAFKQALNKLDNLEIKELLQYFRQSIMVNYFSEAWLIAEKLNSVENWKELAQAALKCLDIGFAIRTYRRLGDVGMVFSLLKIKDIEDKNLLAGYIAMFLGDFNLAQDLFLNSTNPGAALNMRRDLLHWDSALQLAKALEPSQIPFISREYAGQLEFIGDYVNAMLNYERGLCNNDAEEIGGNKDLSEHINACTTGIARMAIRLGDTKRGVMMAEQSNNRLLMKECAVILDQTKQIGEAAALYEKSQYYEKAISSYIRLKNWNKVGQLLKHVSSPKLHLQYAKAREAEGKFKEAVASYELAKDYDSVIRVNLEHLNNPEEAVRIVKATNSKEGAHYVAQFFIRLGDFASAIQFLVMSKCHNDALRLAQDHGQMETYAKIIGSDATIEDYQNIATYFENHKNQYLAGKFYLLACQYEKAIKHLLKVTYVEDSPAVDLAIETIGRANDDKLTHYLVEYLMGEYDNIPKNMKYLFKMYMALKQYREAGRTAILIAKDEQNNGNYRMAHDLLFSMMQELKQNNIKIPSEMSNNLMLIHSYIIAKLHIKRGDHLRGAKMLIRVAESISKFPSHVVPILTSTVIECHRSGLRDSSFSYAAMLLRPEYRDQIDPKYIKKMETIVRRPDKTQEEEPKTECPFCSNLVLETTLQCNECKSSISYCIASGKHIIKDDCVMCPKCEFPAIGSELRSLLIVDNSVCPMCSETISANELKQIIDISEYLRKFNQSIE